MIYIFLFIALPYLTMEAGASLPWSKKWQDKVSWYSEVPEGLIALIVGTVGVWGVGEVCQVSPITAISVWIIYIGLVYAGKQSGTWAYLNWEGYQEPNTDRDGTLKPINDFIAGLFSFKLGDEGYSWVWAATKGLIITLPIGGIGAILFPLGHELGSHAKGRLPGDPNMWKEFASGLGLGLACVIFLTIIKLLTS